MCMKMKLDKRIIILHIPSCSWQVEHTPWSWVAKCSKLSSTYLNMTWSGVAALILVRMRLVWVLLRSSSRGWNRNILNIRSGLGLTNSEHLMLLTFAWWVLSSGKLRWLNRSVVTKGLTHWPYYEYVERVSCSGRLGELSIKIDLGGKRLGESRVLFCWSQRCAFEQTER